MTELVDRRYKLHNRQTGKVAFIGPSVTSCQNYGIRHGLITKDRSAFFVHLTLGWWAIDRMKGDELTE